MSQSPKTDWTWHKNAFSDRITSVRQLRSIAAIGSRWLSVLCYEVLCYVAVMNLTKRHQIGTFLIRQSSGINIRASDYVCLRLHFGSEGCSYLPSR